MARAARVRAVAPRACDSSRRKGRLSVFPHHGERRRSVFAARQNFRRRERRLRERGAHGGARFVETSARSVARDGSAPKIQGTRGRRGDSRFRVERFRAAHGARARAKKRARARSRISHGLQTRRARRARQTASSRSDFSHGGIVGAIRGRGKSNSHSLPSVQSAGNRDRQRHGFARNGNFRARVRTAEHRSRRRRERKRRFDLLRKRSRARGISERRRYRARRSFNRAPADGSARRAREN